ncbi:TetR family transcriptional regulator [Sphingomonas sp. TDK1]|nr:TetR family transcriptional regulator [Sphingomonas sp. TDK1]
MDGVDEAAPAKRPRNAASTRGIILGAAKALLAEQGFARWGVNAIARASGYDKQLIYRYFGGMDGLAQAIAEDVSAWMETALVRPENAAPPATYAELMARVAVALLDALRSDPLAQKILVWELSAPSSLATAFSEARGKALSAWIARERGTLQRPAGIDAPMLNALLIASIQQLVLSGAASGRFLGLELKDEAGWERVRGGIAGLTRAMYQ